MVFNYNFCKTSYFWSTGALEVTIYFTGHSRSMGFDRSPAFSALIQWDVPMSSDLP